MYKCFRIVAVLAVLLCTVCAWAGELEDTVAAAEKKINELYPTPLAKKLAYGKLEKIIESQLPETEKSQKIKDEFLKQTLTDLGDTDPITEQNAAKLVKIIPLTWTVHSIGIEYDVKNVKQILVSSEQLTAMEERREKAASQGGQRSKSYTNQDTDGNVTTTVNGFRMPDKLNLKSVLTSIFSALNPKGNHEIQVQACKKYELNSGRKESWSIGDQQMLRSNFTTLAKRLESTEISGCHLIFSITFKNNTDSIFVFDATATVPVYADSQWLLQAGPVGYRGTPKFLIPAHGTKTIAFRGDLDNTRALALMEYMCKSSPDIRLQEGQLNIMSLDKKIVDAVSESINSDTVPISLGNMTWNIQRIYNGREVTIREALWAINALYTTPLFEKSSWGIDAFCIKRVPGNVSVIWHYNGLYDFALIGSEKLDAQLPSAGIAILLLDQNKVIKDSAYPWELRQAIFNARKEWVEHRENNAGGQVLIGWYYENGYGCEKNYTEAVNWYRKAADQGDAWAQTRLGWYYLIGRSVKKDEAEAVECFRKAANQDYAQAQYDLGFCYQYGKGVEKDEAEAVNWYRKAANQGHIKAQLFLAMCYDLGRGIEKNERHAVKWFRKAAEQGDAAAQFALGDSYYFGRGLEKDDVEMVKWYRKAAEQGYVHAQYNLGLCYAKGKGVEKDEAEAVRWYRKAANQGHINAKCHLGLCYAKGKGVEKDEAEAVKWFRKAAEQGSAAAQFNLGQHYRRGEGVEKNQAEAVKWYRSAANQGDVNAQTFLGVCYANGDGVEKDLEQAKYWWQKAANQGSQYAQKNLNRLNSQE